MRYRLLGNSGLRVSEAALGTMTFGEDWGRGAAKEEARKVYDAFRSAASDPPRTPGSGVKQAWEQSRDSERMPQKRC